MFTFRYAKPFRLYLKMFVVFVRIQVSEVSLYWSNVLQASAKKKNEKCLTNGIGKSA